MEKIIKKVKWVIDLILRLKNGGVPSPTIKLAILSKTPEMMRPIHSVVGFSKENITSQVIKEIPNAINFTDIGPKVFLEPVFSIGTGIQYVVAAATIDKKRQRIATLAAFLATLLSEIKTVSFEQ